MFNEYLKRHAKVHKKTWAEDEAQFKRYLKGWEQRKLSGIKKSDIEKLHHQVGHEKGVYAANRVLALLQTLFSKAIEYSLWEKSNPTEGIKKFKEQSRDRFLQSDEFPRFFSALIEETNEKIRDYIPISLLTGARRSNVQAMKWAQVNLDLGEWRIPETKNGTPQTVTLCNEALIILKNLKSRSESEYVFPGSGKLGHLVEPKKGWKRVLNRAGIANLRLHDLRRTLGSWQAKTGASLAIIGKSLNHKSPQSTAIYARLDLDSVRQSIEKAANAILMTGGLRLSFDGANANISEPDNLHELP